MNVLSNLASFTTSSRFYVRTARETWQMFPEQRLARLITRSRVNELATLNTSLGFPSSPAVRV